MPLANVVNKSLALLWSAGVLEPQPQGIASLSLGRCSAGPLGREFQVV